MTVEIPELLRRAMELRGVDPDEVAAKAQEIRDAGGVDAIPDRPYERPPARRIVEEADRQETLPLSDPDQNTLGAFHGPDAEAPDTERQAAVDVYPRTGTQRRAVLDYLARCRGGATDEQIREATGVRRARTRRHELCEGGWVQDSGVTRRVASGNEAEVWMISEAGMSQWRAEQRGYERDE